MEFGTSCRLAVMVCATALAACTQVIPGPPGVRQMGVRSFLDIRHLCSLGVSPPIELDGAPQAARYRVRFINESVLYAPPTDYEVAAEGSGIAEGALEGYRGSCPGEAQSFTFRVDVMALDAAGNAVAFGQTRVVANSTTRLMRMNPALRPQMPAPAGQSSP